MTSAIRNTEIIYYSNELETHKNDISKSWKILKTIIGKKRNNCKQKLSFLIDESTITDSQVIANEFNNFFVSIGRKLSEGIVSTNDSIFIEVSVTEVRTTILSLNNSTPGWDEFPTFVAKKSIDNYIMPLTHVINKSLKEGVIPSELKLAKVVPIFKAGATNKITNYGPISVLSFFSKVFEKIIYHKLIEFLDHNGILYCYQFGFRQGHSTQQAIITLVNKITSCLDCGDLVIGIFLDLKKAFDTVDHKILLKKLYAYGIRGVALKLLESYLSGRSQYVVYDYQQSATLSITCGVPQGSVLGPLLFIIYMNDICNVSQLLFTVLYADDTCVLVNRKSLNLIIETVNSELQILSTWLKSNKLSLNTTKSYYAGFHRARMKLPNNSIKLKIDNTNIKEVQSIK